MNPSLSCLWETSRMITITDNTAVFSLRHWVRKQLDTPNGISKTCRQKWFFKKYIIYVCIFFHFFCLPPCDRAVANLTRDYLSPQFPHCLLAAVCSIGPTQAWRAEVQHRKTENTKQRQRERQRDRDRDRDGDRKGEKEKPKESCSRLYFWQLRVTPNDYQTTTLFSELLE